MKNRMLFRICLEWEGRRLMELTSAMQHYIQAIYELSPDGDGVRISDIASKAQSFKVKCMHCQRVTNRNPKENRLRQKGFHRMDAFADICV